MNTNLQRVLLAPEKPITVPAFAQWLSGEGCGSWFAIEKIENQYLIYRYSPTGTLECSGYFSQTAGKGFDMNCNYSFTYLSHCAEVKLIQNQQVITFKRVKKC